MNPVRAWSRGLRMTFNSPGLLLWLWVLNLMAALPAALLMRAALADSIGASLMHQGLREGFDTVWYSGFRAHAHGLAATFSPSVLKAGPFYDNLQAWFDGRLFSGLPGMVALGVVYALLWMLLLGGVVEHFHQKHRPGNRRFTLEWLLRYGARYFTRFFRLGVASGVLYYGVYRLARWGFGGLEQATRDVTTERSVLLYVLLVTAAQVLLMHLIRLIFDYAKVVMVVEEHASPWAALRQALGFVRLYPGPTLGLHLLAYLVGAVVLAVYAWVAPGAQQSSGWTVLGAFFVGQLFLVARLGLRLGLLGGEVELFSAGLAVTAVPAGDVPTETDPSGAIGAGSISADTLGAG